MSTRTDTLFPDTSLFRSRELGSFLADCGLLIASGLVEYEYALFCDDGIACEQPSKWLPTIQLRCEFDVTDPARFYELMLSRSEEHTSELQSLMRISYAVFCLKKKTPNKQIQKIHVQNSRCTTTNNKMHTK